MELENCSEALALQDHAVRSVLSQVYLSHWQVPADQKSGKASTQDHQSKYVHHKHYHSCMPKHAFMIYFTFVHASFQMPCMFKVRAYWGFFTNLILHPDPKFIHLNEILQYKFHSLRDTITFTISKAIDSLIKGTKSMASTIHKWIDYYLTLVV